MTTTEPNAHTIGQHITTQLFDDTFCPKCGRKIQSGEQIVRYVISMPGYLLGRVTRPTHMACDTMQSTVWHTGR